MAYFLFDFYLVGMTDFPILGKNFPQPNFIIIRECSQNNITDIKIFK